MFCSLDSIYEEGEARKQICIFLCILIITKYSLYHCRAISTNHPNNNITNIYVTIHIGESIYAFTANTLCGK